jgi:molybdopterin synthase catalytic subunit
MTTQSDHILVEVLPEPLQLAKYMDFVADPGAGAIATFSGVTRDTFEGKTVLKLEYEAYAPMAEKVMLVRPLVQRQAACMLAALLDAIDRTRETFHTHRSCARRLHRGGM